MNQRFFGRIATSVGRAASLLLFKGRRGRYRLKGFVRGLLRMNSLGQWVLSSSSAARTRWLSRLPDDEFASKKYMENAGKMLNLAEPATINDKLWWLKLNNRNPLLTRCSDKILVRDFVAEAGFGDLLVPLLGVFDKASDVDFAELPREELFFKTNHGSGQNRILDNSSVVDAPGFIREFDRALSSSYFWASREWNYKGIQPRILCEKVLRDARGNLPSDFKFWCFGGIPKLLFYSEDVARADGRHNELGRMTNIYDMNFQLLPVKRESFRVDPEVNLPSGDLLSEMQRIAGVLSAPFEFCRVDLYCVDASIYFGELTFYPAGGSGNLVPEYWERVLGGWLNLPGGKAE